MKKIKLLLAAMAAMVGLSAQAQTWTSVGAGTYRLYNVGTNSYFDKGNGWGTQASVSANGMVVELVPVGDYVLIRTSGNKDFYGVENLSGGTVYTDQSRNKAATWTFANVGTDADPVYNIISANDHGGGAGAYLTAEGGSSTIVGPGNDGNSDLAKWKLEAELNFETTRASIIATMGDATLEAPVDVTGLIGNANFDTGNLPVYWAMASSNKNLCGGDASNYCAESYHASFTLTQTIKNIPNGKYELTAQAAMNGSDAIVYANDKTASFEAMTEGENSMSGVSASFTAGKYTVGPITVIVTDETLTIGTKCTNTSSWCVWDNFQLKYYGIDLSALQDDLAEKVAAAAALEGTIPAAAYNVLNAVVTEYNKTYSTAEGYEEAIGKIDEATANAMTLVAPYAAYKTLAANAAIAGVASETINAQNAAAEEATTVDAFYDCLYILQTAINALAFDITSFTIKNPTAQTKDNWEGTNFGGQSDGVCEYWNVSPAGFSQTINLPAGTYRLTVVALQRTGMTGTVYAGENSTVIAQVSSGEVNNRGQAATWFNAGNGKNYVYFTLADAADVVIGLKADETTGDHWTVWKSFQLDTFDESVTVGYLAPYFDDLVAGHGQVLDDASYANVTGSERINFEAALAATPSTAAEYWDAIVALSTAVDAFVAAKTNYDLYVSELAIAQAISTSITVDAPTTAAEALDAFKTLKVAEYNYVVTAYPYSATSKIGEFSTWERTGTVNGNTKNEFEALTSQHWSGTARTYYEQPAGGWGANAWTANYTKTTTILPAGEYIIKVAARAASSGGTTAYISCEGLTSPIPTLGDTGKGITVDGVASFDEGTFAVQPNNGGEGCGWVWNYLPFTLTEDKEVTLTVVAEATGTHQWFSVCDGELLSKTDIATVVAYDETSDNTIEDVDVAKVTMTRTIKAGFNTVVLPFDLTANQVQEAFGTGTEVYAFSENGTEDAESITINFNKVIAGTISANVPVLVKATEASTEQVFEGVQVVAPAEGAIVPGTNASFVGVFAPTTIGEGHFFIGDGALYKSAGTTNINAFRAYILLENPNVSPKEIKMFVDGEEVATGIEGVQGVQEVQGAIYNLAGQRISKMQKGINIVNGKKVLK